LNCTPTETGTFRIQVDVRDQAGMAWAYTDLEVGLLRIDAFTASPATVYVGSPTTLTVEVTGTAPFTYAYSGLPSGCSSHNASSLECTPDVPGNFTIGVLVTESIGLSATASTNLTVEKTPEPSVVEFNATPSTLQLGESTVLKTNATAGNDSSWLSYEYFGLPTGCISANTSSLTCSPTKEGDYNATVTVTNSFGNSASSNTTVVVVAAARPIIEQFVADPFEITLGNSTVFEVTATATNATLTYSYSGLPPGCTSRNLSGWTCTPTSFGSYNVTVTVTSSWGPNSSANVTLLVKPSSPFISSFVVSPSSIYLGQAAHFSVQAAGSNLSYSYAGMPVGCQSENESALTCTPLESGNFTITVTATNSAGLTSHASVSLTVIRPATLVITSFTATPANITLGSSTRISVIVSGSVGFVGYTFTGLPTGCPQENESTIVCTPRTTGNFTIVVNASDQLGRTTLAELNLRVSPALSVGASPSPELTRLDIVVIAAVGTVAAVILGIVILNRRWSRDPGNRR
jgi:hypothetical protein